MQGFVYTWRRVCRGWMPCQAIASVVLVEADERWCLFRRKLDRRNPVGIVGYVPAHTQRMTRKSDKREVHPSTPK